MHDVRRRILILILLLPCSLVAAAIASPASGDTIFIDLLANDPTMRQVGSAQTYVNAVDIVLPERMAGATLEAALEATIRFEEGSRAMLVFSIMAADTLRYWDALPLNPNDSEGLASTRKQLLLPPDYLHEGTMRVYFWNPDSATFTITSATVQLRLHKFPDLLPVNRLYEASGPVMLLYQTPRFELHFHPETGHLLLADGRGRPLTGPWQWHLEMKDAADTLRRITDGWKLKGRFFSDSQTTAVLSVSNGFERVRIRLTTDEKHGLRVSLKSRAGKKISPIRQALVIPFVEKPVMVFDERALSYDPEGLYSVYLGGGGCLIGKEEKRLALLHSPQMAAVQLDSQQQRLVVNLTYAPSHPLIRYPLDDCRTGFFDDLSAPALRRGNKLTGHFDLWPGRGSPAMPRLMPMPGGAEAAVVWTEHADWTDIRTHRAVHFGCDTILRANEAIGGFDKFGIPVTKSVFFHNPASTSNGDASRGLFKGQQATLADYDFRQLAEQLHQRGHEICLHTPEQYTSRRAWMRKALSYTHQLFGSITWIDHGYNNSSQSNRENLVGDGLNKKSRHYSANIWRKSGIRYLWNPALEELRPYEQYGFDGNFIIPYPGFGPVLPAPVFSKHHHVWDFLLWNTTGTLEMPEDGLWDYTFSPSRLERLMSYHSIWINHVYPAWTLPGKGFWIFDADSNLVVMPGFNRALERLSALGKTGRLLNTTLVVLAAYHEALEKVELVPLDGNVLRVINHNPFTIAKLSFSTSSSDVELTGREFSRRRHNGATYLWFDLPAGETAEISY